MSLRNSRRGDKTPPGPAHQVSRPAERGAHTRGAVGAGEASGCVMIFSQVFVMAPIRSQDAELVFDVTQSNPASGDPSSSSLRGSRAGGGGVRAGSVAILSRQGSTSPQRVGTCRVSLRELADQREHDLPLSILKKARS